MWKWFKGGLLVISTIGLLAGCASTSTEEATATDNTQAAALNIQLGLNYLQHGYYDRAKKKLLKALTLAPHYAQSQVAIGYYYANVGQNTLASQYYQEALRLAPDDPAVQSSYAIFLCNTRQYQKAQQYWQKALASPKNMQAGKDYYQSGVCSLQAGDKVFAGQQLQLAIKNNPALALPYAYLAKLAIAENHYSVAQKYLAQYLSLAAPNILSLEVAIALAEHNHIPEQAAAYRLQLQAMKQNL